MARSMTSGGMNSEGSAMLTPVDASAQLPNTPPAVDRRISTFWQSTYMFCGLVGSIAAQPPSPQVRLLNDVVAADRYWLPLSCAPARITLESAGFMANPG